MIFLLLTLVISQEYQLSNSHLTYIWGINNNNIISTKKIENHDIHTPFALVPSPESEEFIIHIKENNKNIIQSSQNRNPNNYFIKSSHLQVQDVKLSESKIEIIYKSYDFRGITWNIKEFADLDKNKHYLHKYIQIKSSNNNVFIDYIDLGSLILDDNNLQFSWSTPLSENTLKNLGQPIYINSLFIGCRFPLTESIIESNQNLARIRYYAGKKFSDFTLNSDGYYETWKTVFGVSHSNEISFVRNDFFAYISDISAPTQLRTQYSDPRLSKSGQSFEDIEKGLSQFGLPPIDSFVINDKTMANKVPTSKLARKIGTSFGINFHKEENVPNSKAYIEKVQKNIVNYIRKYKVNYINYNGFLENPSFSSNDIYRLTDLWENIIASYREVLRAAKEEGIANFWISSPAFTNLSPFHLQWANSIVKEVPKGMKVADEEPNPIDELITLCDQHHWSFYEHDQVQFPPKSLQTNENLKSKKNAVDAEEFRRFLYASAMRGSSLFELNRFGQKMTNSDDKWLVNSDVFSWVKKNFDCLQNSQRFGGQPIKGEIYGYSAWSGNDGVIAIRNPGQKEAKFTVKLDSKIGLNNKMETVYRSTTFHHKAKESKEISNGAEFHYGDQFEVKLQKNEFRIYEFHTSVDSSLPVVEVIKTTTDKEVLIRFNKQVDLSDSKFKIKGLQVKDKKLRGDLRTVLLTTSAMKNYSVYSMNIEKVKDKYGNTLNTQSQYQHFANKEIVSIRGEITGNDNAILLTDVNTDSFSINLHVKNFKGIKKGYLIHSEDNSIIVEIDQQRHIKFTVGSVSVTSHSSVRDNRDYQFTFVRERNAILKIYKNQKLDNCKYIKEKPNLVNIKKLRLNKNDVVYSSIIIDNYAVPYNEVPYEISLKNQYIEQTFSIENRKVQTKQIINHRSEEKETFKPATGSEEWTISIPDATKSDSEVIIKSSDCLFNWEYRRNSKNEETIAFYYYYKYNRVHFNITKTYQLLPESYYIEKQLEIKCSDSKQQFYYIDLDTYTLSESDETKSWTHPIREQDTYSRMSPFIINLGQPIYINSFFTGCLFPLTDNKIENHISRIRYHTGKTFSQLLKDNLIEENQDIDGYYCWKTIFGAARSSRFEVVRKDLFDFIASISVPTTFRKQYNSWYDWMLSIDESNILESFKEIENGFNHFGVPPLDSYVVDDGWNNYNSLKYDVYDQSSSGDTYNNEGFWTFNSKFPNGFIKPSDFTHRISSRFGSWLGPRGGYVTPGQFGKIIEDSNKGYFNSESNDVDVGSIKYINNLDSFLTHWINEYKVNYLKLDGFAFKACNDNKHDHMIGGPEGIYYFTDLWERYLLVFEHLREVATSNQINDFWISITSYVNPSPFHLQWSNSVWLQVSDDIGYITTSMKDNYANQMLTYRDSCYYDFYDHHQFQFPSKCLFNHDPIYGKANTPLNNSIDNEYFRIYLYFCAMRGNAFTEMHYSYSMLNEGDKWYISSEVLKWTESHFDVIQNSQRFGDDPKNASVYGYSAWNEKSGIIAIRNPSGRSTQYTLKLDRNIGVPENIGSTYRKSILAHNTQQDLEEGKLTKYNDEIQFDLKPREVRIIEFTQNEDKEKPKVELVKALSKQRVLVRFNKKIIKNIENYEIEDLEIHNVSIKGDRRSVILRTDPMEKNKEYKLEVEDVVDQFGNKLDKEEIKFTYFAHGIFSSANNRKRINTLDSETVLTDVELTTDSFSIQLDISQIESNQNVVILEDSEKSISAEIVDCKMKFTVGQLSVTSMEDLPIGNCVVILVRERNKMIKIYINGEISNSAYDPSIKDELITIHKITLKQAPINYNNVYASNYAFKYNEEANTDENDEEKNDVDPDDDHREYFDDEEDIETPTAPPDPDGNDKKHKKSAIEELKVYIIVACVLFGIAVIAAVVLAAILLQRKKEDVKQTMTYPLVSESL